MNKLAKRLLTFFIGVPAVFAIIFFLPFYRHLVWNIVVIFFSAVGAVEFSSMLEKKQLHISKIEAFILGALTPLAGTLMVSFNLPEWIFLVTIILGAVWILVSRTFSSMEKIENVTNYIAAGSSTFLYPGFFMFWLVKLSDLNNSGLIILFLLITFGSDAIAWLTGSLFGKNNRGIIPVSPNKSIAGFIGGLIISIILIGVAVYIAPSVFVVRMDFIPVPLIIAIFGICMGLSTALGDLAESAIKRSCGVKDSGTLMQGRGGILDTIDSVAVAAPVYYALFNVFFINP